MSKAPDRRYLPGIDGLRAIAVVAVVLFHLGAGWLPGGFLGVDVFFVISGFLITSHLWQRGHGEHVHLRVFWLRRVRRLLPAVIALICACSLAVALFDRDHAAAFVGDAFAAATYTSNWWYVLHERSYFDALGRPPVLQHLWSLAIEEQFYIVWPLVFLAAGRLVRDREKRRQILLAVCAGGFVVSSLWMAIGTAVAHAPADADASRFYFGTDSHAFGLLAGGALALWAAASPLPAHAGMRRTRYANLALLALLVILCTAHADSTWLYRIGFPVVVLLVVVLVRSASIPGPFSRMLGSPFMRDIGQRSYSLYLWHWPVVCFMRPGDDIALPTPVVVVLQLLVMALLTEVSYRFVEEPFRRHGIVATFRSIVRGPQRLQLIGGIASGTAVASVVAVCVIAAVVGTPQAADAVPNVAAPTALPGPAKVKVASPSATPKAAPSVVGDPGVWRIDPAAKNLSVYGDSVALGAVPGLRHAFQGVISHAVVGSQAGTDLDALRANAGVVRKARPVVLVHVGDNGRIATDQLRSTLDALPDVPVLVVRPRVPRDWQQHNLSVIDSVARGRANVRVVDWYSASESHPEFFVADRVHLTTAGIATYSALVRDAVRQAAADAGFVPPKPAAGTPTPAPSPAGRR